MKVDILFLISLDIKVWQNLRLINTFFFPERRVFFYLFLSKKYVYLLTNLPETETVCEWMSSSSGYCYNRFLFCTKAKLNSLTSVDDMYHDISYIVCIKYDNSKQTWRSTILIFFFRQSLVFFVFLYINFCDCNRQRKDTINIQICVWIVRCVK